MRCNQCTDKPKTAGDVRGCSICVNDRTANEIPHDLGDETLLEAALERKPGLGNRFTPEPTPPAAERGEGTQEAPPAPRRKRGLFGRG